jgi:hypothetical protein
VALAVVVDTAGSHPDVIDPSRPTLLADEAVTVTAPASLMTTPVRIPVGRLTALLEDAVPMEYGSLDRREDLPGHDRTDLAFQLRRSPFRASLDGSTATVHTTVQYKVRVFYNPPLLPEMSGSCGTGEGEAPPRLAVTLRAPVALDRRWRLRTHAEVVSITPASDEARDRCTMTFLGVDVTHRIVDAARDFLEGHVDDVDTLAATADVRSSFDGWWRTLQQPIHLTDSLWLSLRPEAIRRGRARGVGDSVQILLALQARPAISYGPRPSIPGRALPPLDSGSVSDGLDLRVEARAEYGPASDFLQQELGGRVLEHQGRRFTLDSMAVFGIGAGRLALEIHVSGDVTGRLYLVGTPHIDPGTGRISVPDLDFDLATRDMVLAAAAWMKADELRDLLRRKASWPAAPAVAFLSSWLDKGLNRHLSDDLRVRGQVDTLRIVGVRALRDALLIQVAARGSAEIFIAGER